MQQLALVHEDLKRRLEVDVYGINPSKARGIGKYGPPWSEGGYDKLIDEWGIDWWKPQDGGFIFNTVHNIQADVPPENIVAMWEALRESGVYAKE